MAESKVRDDNFFLVAGWMLNRLNLKGAALQVFAIIHGFSQDGEGSFTGSLQYLCDFTNTTKNTVIKALKELTDIGYVIKTENYINGVQFNTYKVNAQVVQKLHWGSADSSLGGSAKIALGGSAETAPNNKDLDNKDNISKSIEEVISLYHSICVSFPTIRAVSDARKKAVQNLLKTYTIDDFRTVFTNAEASSFLKGSDGGWKASFDWMIKESNLLKILEGNYAGKPKRGRKEPVPGWMGFKMGEEEKESIYRMMEKPIDMEELEQLEAEQEKELTARAERLKKLLRE